MNNLDKYILIITVISSTGSIPAVLGSSERCVLHIDVSRALGRSGVKHDDICINSSAFAIRSGKIVYTSFRRVNHTM